MTLAELNGMGPADAERALRACCDVARWTQAMIEHRPFRSLGAVLAWADTAWRHLGPDDWREMFRGHPRIGGEEVRGPADLLRGPHQASKWRRPGNLSAQARLWSAGEQARAADADHETRTALALVNREYEARFGHIFLTCAMGKSATAILAEARSRMANEPARELEVAAEEQRKIMRLRLRSWLGAGEGAEA